MPRAMLAALGCAFLFAIVGCNSDGDGKFAIKGTVNFENKPLDKGNIFFELDDPQNPHISGAPIEAGKFTIPKNQGLKPGTYLVRISSADPTQMDANQAPGDSRAVAKDRIPAKWNTESKEKIEVKAGATEFTFDIK